MARRNPGRKWRIVGSVWKAGKRIRRVTKTVIADSEAKIEQTEKKLKRDLVDQITAAYKGKELRNVKIEVESDIY